MMVRERERANKKDGGGEMERRKRGNVTNRFLILDESFADMESSHKFKLSCMYSNKDTLHIIYC